MAIATLLISCEQKESLPYYNTADLTPVWEEKKETFHTVAPFSFTDQDGRMISDNDFKGKIYVANFFFTICPGICPKLTSNMKLVADEFEDDDRVRFISHSVTPGIDSVPRLKKYADRFEIDSKQWRLVTGEKEEIYALARNSYFAETEQGFQKNTDFIHTEHFMLIDSEGHVRGVYKGTLEPEMVRLEDDIRLLLSQL
ncbi:MAG TPA: SCO family protein [Cyclobacteriaceae bacterium]|nr:SCO family protein [Cyclobacteriaceae bacterium]